MPLLALPLALIGLVALPALAAIYVLRTRYRRRDVSSLMLWQAAAQATGGGRKASQMQTPWVLLLELLALLLLVLAATMPRWLATGQRARVMVVLDNSWSMRAVDADGRSARERGADAVREELSSLGRYTAGFVLAGREPVRIATSAQDAAGVLAALGAWSAQATTADLGAAVALARETGGPDVRVVVVSDRLARDDPAPRPMPVAPSDAEGVAGQVRWRAVGVPGDNAAVLRAVRGQGVADRDRFMVEVGRFGSAAGPARTVGIQIDALRPGQRVDEQSAWQVVARRRLALEPGQTTRVWFDPDPAAGVVTQGRLLRVSVAMPGDVLGADNNAWLAAPDAQPLRVAVGVTAPALRGAVDAALSATGRTVRVTDAGEAELWVTDATFPAASDPRAGAHPTPGCWSLRFLAPADADETRAFLGPFLLDTAHPVMADLGLAGVVWSAVADTARLAAWTRGADAVLASAGEVALITWTGGDNAEIGVNLDAARSTLTGGVAWPVLMSNAVQARVAGRPGARPVNLPVGSPVALRAGRSLRADAVPELGAADAAPQVVRVRRVAGLAAWGSAAGSGAGSTTDAAMQTLSLSLRDGAATWTAPRPGVYAVELPGLESQMVVAAGTATAESDLSGAASGATGELNGDLLQRPEYRGLGWLLGLCVLSVLMVQAWLLRPVRGHRSGAMA